MQREKEKRDERESGRNRHEFGENGIKNGKRETGRKRDIEFVNISWLKSSALLLIRKLNEGMLCDLLVSKNFRLRLFTN